MPAKPAKSVNAYRREQEILAQALNSPIGVTITFTDRKDARQFQFRAHSYRQLDRNLNREIYPIGHPLYGNSIYDALFVLVESNVVTIRHPPVGVVREITEDEAASIKRIDTSWLK